EHPLTACTLDFTHGLPADVDRIEIASDGESPLMARLRVVSRAEAAAAPIALALGRDVAFHGMNINVAVVFRDQSAVTFATAPNARSTSPTGAARQAAAYSASPAPCQPRTAPTLAINLMSPPPIASAPARKRPASAMT